MYELLFLANFCYYVCKILYGVVSFWKLTVLSLIVVLWIVSLTVSFLVIHTIAMDTLNLRIIIWNTPKLQSIVKTNRDDPMKDGLFISTTSVKRFRALNSAKNSFASYDYKNNPSRIFRMNIPGIWTVSQFFSGSIFCCSDLS